jgi:DNA-binding NtrC family response regulator
MNQMADALFVGGARRPGVDALVKRQTAVLIVDDEPGIRNFLQRALARDYGLVEAVDSMEAAEELRQRCRFDILVVDISLPGRSGLEWIENLRAAGDNTTVIFITAYADLNATIGALRAGAADFILKPFRVEQLMTAVERCLARPAAGRGAGAPDGAMAEPARFGDVAMIGSCPPMQEVDRVIRLVAPIPSSVLIEGETGTGKELAAAAIHRFSRRRGSFVAVNCVAIAPELFESELFGHTKGAFTGAHQAREGLFTAARGGTLFLDEISEMPLPMQAKLLRVLESRRIRPVGADHEVPVDVRLVTATNRDLTQVVRTGVFREDLYFRLNVVRLRMPALRDRIADIPELVAFFSRLLSGTLGVAPYVFSGEELTRLQACPWPGNVRELRNVVERTLLLGRPPWESMDGGMPCAGSETAAGGFPAEWTLDQVEKHHTLRVLGITRGNKSEAARRLGISRKTLERKLTVWPETERPG